MRFLELGRVEAVWALALEEAILERMDGGVGDETWLFWTSAELCAVLGTARPLEGDLLPAARDARGVEVLRRRSGGGTVLLSAASPAVTVIAPMTGGIRDCYAGFCDVLIAALGRVGLECVFHPPADLACAGRKVAGLAQRRRRGAALVTASVLVEPLAAEAARFLAEPGERDAPDYRAGRVHGEFMTSLAELGLAEPSGELVRALRQELAGRGAAGGETSSVERERAAEIRAELSDPAWIRRF